jgi:hypothetical protein
MSAQTRTLARSGELRSFAFLVRVVPVSTPSFADLSAEDKKMKASRAFGILLVVLLGWHDIAFSQKWRALMNQPSFGAGHPLLLTNGDVLVQEDNPGTWSRLTPDQFGSYINGTWEQAASLPPGYGPSAYASAVLPDGRVIVEGGEYNFGQLEWTNLGAIYDPKEDVWAPVNPPPGWTILGDAQSVVLPDGTFMVANCCAFPFTAALLDAKTLTWTFTGENKQDLYDEEGWTLLPDGTVLTVDAENAAHPTHAEKYIPNLGKWINAGSTIVLLSDPPTAEIGPAVLRPDGTVFATGANSNKTKAGHTSIYHPPTDRMKPGTWTPGPDIPDENDMGDAPAALLPDGNVLCDTNHGINNPPTTFYEFDGTTFIKVPGPPNSGKDATEQGSMLVLPTGQIFFTDGSSDVEIYTAKGKPDPSWAPVITSSPGNVTRGKTYAISGMQFNGLSQGAMYGDDSQMATNYPLIRITNNASHHVFYARTYDHSTMAVATGKDKVSTHFEVPNGMETGASKLVVVANGIASKPVPVTVH